VITLSRFVSIMLFLLLNVQVACLSSGMQDSKKVFLTGVNLLYGPISEADLFKEYPAWKERYEAYNPDKSIIDSLAQQATDGIKVEIFLGTWCGDSRREVPHFLKIVDKSGFVTRDSVELWAVDRNKELDSAITKQRNIVRVATFIIFYHGLEVGRIIERPESDLLERDILKLVKQIPGGRS